MDRHGEDMGVGKEMAEALIESAMATDAERAAKIDEPWLKHVTLGSAHKLAGLAAQVVAVNGRDIALRMMTASEAQQARLEAFDPNRGQARALKARKKREKRRRKRVAERQRHAKNHRHQERAPCEE